MHELVREYGSEFDWDSNNYFINTNNQQSYFNNIDGYRSGRDVLKAIAFKYKENYKLVMLPALCCESMVKPFEMYGYQIDFFKLNSDMSADFEDAKEKIKENTILVFMDYFGMVSFSDYALNYLKEKFGRILFVEDRTHDIFMKSRRNFIPDYTICSIRKWIAIPDGGLLLTRFNEKRVEKENDAYFGELRTLALKEKSKYLLTGDIKLKTSYRGNLAEANNYLENAKNIADISLESKKLLERIEFKKIISIRRENAQVLSEQIKKIKGVKSFLSDRELGGLYYPIIVKNRDGIQKALAEKKIYCPVIWPIPNNAQGLCKVADYIANHMLAIPCDQRYRKSDMRYISSNLEKIVESCL